MSSASDRTSSMTAVVQLVRSLMPWWAISVSSLAVVSFRAKLLLVMICRCAESSREWGEGEREGKREGGGGGEEGRERGEGEEEGRERGEKEREREMKGG